MTQLTVTRPLEVDAPRSEDRGVRRKFLPEVQALRAVAVLLVVAYHLRRDLVPGGYIGVDVFFVISGYLITGHMIREVRTTGRLRLSRFWANRARRILPAALLLILLVVATATVVIPITEWGNLGRQAVASVFYVQNWVLAVESVDYLAADNAATPFQHFWSLAVEEQFYLLWPLVVGAVAWGTSRVARPRHAETGAEGADGRIPVHHRLTFWLLVAFGVLAAASLSWSIIRVSAGDPSAYFVTTTRLWELAAGGILAVTLRYTDRLPLLRSVLALGGLAAIGIGTFTLTASSPFPGVNALWPVLGSVAVIAAGRTSGPGSLTWLVDNAAVQWIGNVSYSLYLWHFPIAIYFMARWERQPTLLEAIGLIGVMLAGSALSYYAVEQPIRTAGWARRSDPRALIAAGVAMVLVAVSASTFWIVPDQQSETWDRAAKTARTQGETKGLFGAAAPRAGSYQPFTGTEPVMTPNPVVAKKGDRFLAATEGRCEQRRAEGIARRCDFGDPDAETTVAVVGDSHAQMFIPPVLRVAQRHGWHVVTFIRVSCPYSQTPRTIPDGEDCVAANAFTARRLAKLEPDIVVTAFYADSRFVGGREASIEGLASAWRELGDLGARVVVIKDAPKPYPEVVSCVAEHYEHPGKCSVKRKRAMASHGLVDRAAQRVDAARVLDLTDRFCDNRRCYAVLGDVLVYCDRNHVGDTYATTLAPDIEPALVELAQKHD